MAAYGIEPMDMASLFAAGAYSVATERGASDAEARSFAAGMLKGAAMKNVRFDEDEEEEEEDTWWNRNKKWALPAAVGLGAYLVGADAGRYGRADRNYFSSALDLLGRRVQALFGITKDPWMRSMTTVQK